MNRNKEGLGLSFLNSGETVKEDLLSKSVSKDGDFAAEGETMLPDRINPKSVTETSLIILLNQVYVSDFDEIA